MRNIVIAALIVVAPAVAHAQDVERTVTSLAKIGFANSPTLSPDGTRVAFLTNLSGSPQLWSVPIGGGYPQALTSLDDPVLGAEWSPDGSQLAVAVAPGGGLNSQIWLLKADGTSIRRVVGGGKENNWLGVWSADGSFFTYSSNVRDATAMDGYIYDIAKGESRLVVKNRGVGTFDDLSDDGRFALINRLESRGDNNVVRVDLKTGAEVLITSHTPPGNFEGKFGRDGNIVYLRNDLDRDLTAFSRVTIAADGKVSAPQLIAARPDAELSSFSVDPSRAVALLVWNVAGRSEVSVVDLASGAVTRGPKLPFEIVGGVTFARDGRNVVLAGSAATKPSDLYVWENVRAGQSQGRIVRQLTRSSSPGVDLSTLVAPELVQYKAHDGLDLSGWLYLPRGASRSLPVVFSFHGGPEGQERPSLNSTYQALLSRGIAVFAPNVRGSSGFGKRFVNLDNGALRVNSVRDIQASVQALIARGVADPRRLGIMGGSYGGYMVMAGLTEYPDMFAAGANLFGVVNFKTFFEHSEPWMAEISTVEYGNPQTEADMLASLSPINKIDRVKAATLVLHGANDTNVPVLEAEQVVEKLKSRGVPVEYILFPDEGHGWRKTTNRVKSAVSIVDFFERHLAGKPQ